MSAPTHATPGEDLAGYLVGYTRDMAFGEEDPVAVLDRYYTADFVHVNDGLAMDRAALIAHAKPARRNTVAAEVLVHDALVSGDRAAARYTLRTEMRKGARLAFECYLFGELAPDGRLRRVVSTTRDVSPGTERRANPA
ncbi:nuclear transport factor 2 family protein [Streptomyces hoynatensis]|uniref:Nuclear transport factor 2 family protein n=1 Tax=Streptomyces hoynatensis TaxID=1141874 RepID=A0A3A9YDA4_9ACTN|nr:nuclear transport factor 2 family protein [Streptomyces hoynatensis]RKN35159.1 nuclear transport factor 2 family protein [Streptomyces hoynatensis]